MPKLVLLAQKNEPLTWELLQEQWRVSGSELLPVWPFAVAATALVALIGTIWLWRRLKQKTAQPAPLRVFRDLAEDLGLTLADQVLLIRIAHEQALPSPLTLILSPTTFEHHFSRYAQTLSSIQRPKATARAQRIARELFGLAGVPWG